MVVSLIKTAVYVGALLTSPEAMLADRYGVDLGLAYEIGAGAECGNIPLNVVFSIVYVESRFDDRAVGLVGEIGLMQVKPSTAGLPRSELFDPKTNVCAGSKYLTQLNKQFGNLRTALAAYNAGPGRVKELHARGIQLTKYPRLVMGD